MRAIVGIGFAPSFLLAQGVAHAVSPRVPAMARVIGVACGAKVRVYPFAALTAGNSADTIARRWPMRHAVRPKWFFISI